MSNFFKGLQNLVSKIFMILLLINVGWYLASLSIPITYPYPSDFKTEKATVVLSSILISLFWILINWILGSFVIELKDKNRNTERLITMEISLKRIEEVIKKIESNISDIKVELERVKERQNVSDNKQNQRKKKKKNGNFRLHNRFYSFCVYSCLVLKLK